MTRRITLLLALLLVSRLSLALDPFVISDIRVDGLQRISEGTVFNYLPLDPGEQLTSAGARSAIRELYRTGFFRDIQFSREGDILVITVQERPAISSISVTGNKAIKEEELLRALNDIGLSEGEVFNQATLDRVQQELIRQYFAQGRYAVDVDARVTELERNRVRIAIVIDEGDTAKIRHINIVGNTVFEDEDIQTEFESKLKPWWKFWSKDDQYSREKLSGDLEKIRSYYQDRGYIDFNVESTQVSISPDKQDIYITANITEGDIYTIDGVQITGDLIVEEPTLRRLILSEEGQIFSRKNMEQSVENITALLSNLGYAFANVNPIPLIDRDDLTVSINFFVDPGKRVYIRRVTFVGNSNTADEVLRREMRQFEGAWFSQAAIDRSKTRLQRMTYFEEVEIETPAVPGTDDQVDVVVSITERASGSFSVGVGYSQIQGLILSLAVNQDNFLGSGKRVGLGLSHSDILTNFSVSYENPYWTDDGISRGFFLRYSEFDRGAANISTFTSSEAAAGMNFGLPLTEVDFLRAGVGIRATEINIGSFVNEFFFPIDPDFEPIDDPDNIGCEDINMNGICPESFFAPTPGDPLSSSLDFNGDGVISKDEREFDAYDINASWTRDSRNHFLNPTRGSVQRLAMEATLPGSSREFWKVFYRYQKYIPVWGSLVFSYGGDLGYGDSYDSYDDDSQATGVIIPTTRECLEEEKIAIDTGLPFWEHFYGGGVRDIRGFDDNTLGPKDSVCRAVGGDFKVSGSLELAFPVPGALGGNSGTRLAVFVDVGNVYENYDAFDAGLLRASTGISVTWQAPVGPIVINYAIPIRDFEGDETESLQFSFGTTF